MAIKKHIPNTITCCNLVSGCVAIAYAFSGKIELSFTWIIIGAVFDFFDGMSARLLKVSYVWCGSIYNSFQQTKCNALSGLA